MLNSISPHPSRARTRKALEANQLDRFPGWDCRRVRLTAHAAGSLILVSLHIVRQRKCKDMTVRIGFVGTGFMGQLAHLHSFSQVHDCEIVAVAEARPKLGKQVAERYGISTVYGSHEDLLKDDTVDALVCSQPYHRNYYLGRAVLGAGRSLFTEKPMAATVADARELVAIAEQNHLVYAVGFMKRYDAGIQLARSVISDFE